MLKKILLTFNIADNWINNRLKCLFPTRYVLTGKCNQCGSCCKRILLSATPNQIRSRLFMNFMIRWYEWLFNFKLLDIDYEDNYIAFSCSRLTPEGKCGAYKWRPGVCRNYPLVDYFKETVTLPECGFRSKLR